MGPAGQRWHPTGLHGGSKKATLMLDIYNLLNADPVTNFNLSVTAPRTVIAVLDPRVFQMGFRFEF